MFLAGSVTAIILLFLAGFLLILGVPGLVEMVAARRWVEVPGTIAMSGVGGYTGRSGPRHSPTQYNQAVVAYSYQYGGQVYGGQRLTLGRRVGYGSPLRGISEGQAARLQPGQAVTVWVDPDHPERCTLDRRAPVSVIMSMSGLAALVLALFSL
jgi:hypothetical protein